MRGGSLQKLYFMWPGSTRGHRVNNVNHMKNMKTGPIQIFIMPSCRQVKDLKQKVNDDLFMWPHLRVQRSKCVIFFNFFTMLLLTYYREWSCASCILISLTFSNKVIKLKFRFVVIRGHRGQKVIFTKNAINRSCYIA